MKKVYQAEYSPPFSKRVKHYWFLAASKAAILRSEFSFLKPNDITLRVDVEPFKGIREI